MTPPDLNRPALGGLLADDDPRKLAAMNVRRNGKPKAHAEDVPPLDAYAEPPVDDIDPGPRSWTCDRSDGSDQRSAPEGVRSPRAHDDPPFDLPPDVRLWTPDDDVTEEQPRLIDGPAFDTWPGRLVLELAPYTEADPAAMLLTLLTAAGASIGASPHVPTGNTRHPGRLHAVLVGDTARGRKGTSWEVLAPIIEAADPDFYAGRIMGGFGSGEAVVDEVADPDENGEGGSADKRLLVKEPELTRVLKVANRQGSTLSELVREAWDGGRLQVRSRARRAVATGAHVALVGHVVADGLRRHLNDEDTVNGLANRWLFCAVGRAQVLPHGAEVPATLIEGAGRDLGGLIHAARRRGRMDWTEGARGAWERFYRRCAKEDPGGMVGAITARAEPQVARLALLFALLDPHAEGIDVDHLAAAEAVWGHNVDTVRWVWGDRDGDPDAAKLLTAIRAHGPGGMTGTEQRDLFGKHKAGRDLERVRERLERRGVIATGAVPTDGRPAVVSVAVRIDRSDGSDRTPLRSPRSLRSQVQSGTGHGS